MKRFWSFIFASIVAFNFLVGPTIEALPSLQARQLETYVSPSARFNTTHDLNAIFSKFRSYGTKEHHFKLFDKIIAAEEFGFFGYHGGRRDYRIFQDIIRIVIEEVLQIPIRPDFHFLRVPGDPLQYIGSAEEFLKSQNYDVNDDLHHVGQQILSVNMALYEFYWIDDNCSVYYFVKDFSFAKHSFEQKLIPFFNMIGIDPVYIHEAFEIGSTTLNDSAILMQLFDLSEYAMVDQQAYISQITGRYTPTKDKPSDVILNTSKSNFPQLRLIMDNGYVLNPFSFLGVKRYDLNKKEVVDLYEQKLRDYIQTLPVDVYQKEIYKEHLLTIWNKL